MLYYNGRTVFLPLMTIIVTSLCFKGTWRLLARVGSVPVSRPAGNDILATIFIIILYFFPHFFFSTVATFSHRRCAWIKKLILRWLAGANKNLGVGTFRDPVGHIGVPWRPLWFCRRCHVASGERVPPLPLGCFWKLPTYQFFGPHPPTKVCEKNLIVWKKISAMDGQHMSA